MEEINRVFSVTVTIDQNWKKPHYPRYKVSHMNIGTATSLKGAEALIQKIVSKDGSLKYYLQVKDIHHFNVREIPLDEPCIADECLSEWLYDKEGNLIDSRLMSNMRNLPGLFSGRTEEQYRFHEGDIVEVETINEISLAFVVAVPPSVERALKINTGTHFHLDDTDDNYIVLTDSDYASHDHVDTLRLFKPQHRIHPSIEKRLRNAYAEYLTSGMREKIALTTAQEKLHQIAEELRLECEIKPYFYEWINFILKNFPEQGQDTHIKIANKLAYEHIDRIRTTLLRLVGKPVSGRGYSLKDDNPAQPEAGARYYAISQRKV